LFDLKSSNQVAHVKKREVQLQKGQPIDRLDNKLKSPIPKLRSLYAMQHFKVRQLTREILKLVQISSTLLAPSGMQK